MAKMKDIMERNQLFATTIPQPPFEDYLTFMSRRLVEMAGNIIMGYLLLLDSNVLIDLYILVVYYGIHKMGGILIHCELMMSIYASLQIVLL